MIRAIIFDLDGTLVDTIDDIGASANALFRRHGYPEHTRDEFMQWIGNGAVKFVEAGFGIKMHNERLRDYVDEFKQIYSENYAVKSKLYDGINDVLDQLERNSVKMAILSNKPHHLTVKVADSYLSKWKINPVFGQRDEVSRKPDPAAAFEIARILEVPAEEIMFVGDSEGDIRTAVAAGMKPVGVTWGYGNVILEETIKYETINKPLELLNLLELQP